MRGRKPLFRNLLSAYLGERRRNLGLSRRQVVQRIGFSPASWERSRRTPLAALGKDPRAELLRGLLDLTVKDLADLLLGTSEASRSRDWLEEGRLLAGQVRLEGEGR